METQIDVWYDGDFCQAEPPDFARCNHLDGLTLRCYWPDGKIGTLELDYCKDTGRMIKHEKCKKACEIQSKMSLDLTKSGE